MTGNPEKQCKFANDVFEGGRMKARACGFAGEDLSGRLDHCWSRGRFRKSWIGREPEVGATSDAFL